MRAGASPPPAVPQNGPAADYPVVVGDPFTIRDTTWTPTDQLNYDAVGYASVAGVSQRGVTAAHKTLPLPSYAEVTSLDSGRTILVRIERRGPMVNDTLVELSQDAARQLGIGDDSRLAVRLRRTNPPEQERAMLRAGGQALERMETPEPLRKVLRRKLAEQSSPVPPPSASSAAPKEVAEPAAVKKAPVAKSQAVASVPNDSMVVQVAAFSVKASADKVASQLGGFVTKPGKYWLVRIGPFANRAQSPAALEKARRAGYRDARIQRAD